MRNRSWVELRPLCQPWALNHSSLLPSASQKLSLLICALGIRIYSLLTPWGMRIWWKNGYRRTVYMAKCIWSMQTFIEYLLHAQYWGACCETVVGVGTGQPRHLLTWGYILVIIHWYAVRRWEGKKKIQQSKNSCVFTREEVVLMGSHCL